MENFSKRHRKELYSDWMSDKQQEVTIKNKHLLSELLNVKKQILREPKRRPR